MRARCWPGHLGLYITCIEWRHRPAHRGVNDVTASHRLMRCARCCRNSLQQKTDSGQVTNCSVIISLGSAILSAAARVDITGLLTDQLAVRRCYRLSVITSTGTPSNCKCLHFTAGSLVLWKMFLFTFYLFCVQPKEKNSQKEPNKYDIMDSDGIESHKGRWSAGQLRQWRTGLQLTWLAVILSVTVLVEL